MKKFKHVFLSCIFFAIFSTGCSTLQTNTKEYNQTAKEIDDIIKHDNNLTDKQKVILQHAKIQIESASQTSKENDKLQQELVKESKLAGAGKMIYTLIYFVGFLIVAFITFKILKKFSIF